MDPLRDTYVTQCYGGVHAYEATLTMEGGAFVWTIVSERSRFRGSFNADGDVITSHRDALQDDSTWRSSMDITQGARLKPELKCHRDILRVGSESCEGGAMTEGPSHGFTRGLYGWITHTELSSTDPEATREWCAEVLGWTFQPPFPSPAGDYHLFAYSDSGGGGIRQTAPGESPGSTPTVHVEDTQAAYDAALAAGAEPVNPPETVMEGVRIAMVRAPGGVLIGFSGPTG